MCRFVILQTAYLLFSSFSITISFLKFTQQLSLLASMLDLSTAVTIESPFVPYSPDSCCIIPRDVSDVYQLVTGDHIVVRWHKPVKGERDEDVMWVWCRITAIKKHSKLIAKFDLAHSETMLCPTTKQDTNNTCDFKLRSGKNHLASWCAFHILVEDEDLPLYKNVNFYQSLIEEPADLTGSDVEMSDADDEDSRAINLAVLAAYDLGFKLARRHRC